MSTKRTYKPSKTSRLKKHGFRSKMSSKKGRDTIKARRAKGRKKVAVSK